MPYKDKELQKQYQREWFAKRRATYFFDKSCKHCSSVLKLELHHLDPSKKITNNIWSWSEERRNKELSKCIVLCKNCHKKETANQCMTNPLCGNILKYHSVYRCRCNKCKAAHALEMRIYRAKKKKLIGL